MEDTTMRRSQSSGVTKAVRGRPFVQGNVGRKPGSKNRTSTLAAALEGDAEELLRTAVAIAKSGDVMMLKFLLGRILPKERVVHVELPATDGDFDAVDAMGRILVAAVSGQIPPGEASALANVVAAYAHTVGNAELDDRLESIEHDLGALK
jgi:hypothetical protein